MTQQNIKYNVLDLFSGCGGFSCGIKESGLDIKVSNEIWEPAFNTHKLNFPNTKGILGDITNPNIKKQIISEAKKQKCNIIIGGPPCQAYSNAGNKSQFDPRGHLYKDYIDIVKQVKPIICIIENVKGILSIKHLKNNLSNEDKKIIHLYKTKETEYKNAKEDKKEVKKELSKLKKKLNTQCNELVINKIIKEFENIGYKIEYKVLNSANYGCPQKRERVIFIASKLSSPIIFPEETHSSDNWVTVRNAIDDIKELKEDKKWSHIYTKHTQNMIKRMEECKYEASAQPKYKEAYFKCHPDKPSLTVKENHGAVFVHYEIPRCMTPRELARLQTFPDNFLFTGSKKDVLIQIGNAVPCKLGSHIGIVIKKMLN